MVARLPKSQTRRLIIPEVIQSSSMDCGPAALKGLLGGYGVETSYGRLREACQTDVDGTSIDTLERLATELGLEAEQVMVPLDHLLIPEARNLPAIVVTRLPNGSTHFVVLWRKHGSWLQVMDPSIGRRWMSARAFLDEVYIHSFPVPAAAWREWAESDEFLGALLRRLDQLGVKERDGAALIDAAVADPSWRGLARLDAAVRMTESLVEAKGLKRGTEARGVVQTATDEDIPSDYWSVARMEGGDDEEEQLRLEGALLVRVSGLCSPEAGSIEGGASSAADESGADGERILPEVVERIREREVEPARRLLEILRSDGLLTPGLLIGALAISAGGLLLEALLLRSLLDMGLRLELSAQRLAAVGAIAGLSLLLLLLDVPLTQGLFRVGRHLEFRLRIAFLRKLPKLGDRYFSSRLSSDMAERCHAIHHLRNLAPLAGQMLRALFEMVLITVGLVWLDPASAPWAVGAAVSALLVPLVFHRSVVERDLRLRSHTGALSRFYLDGLLGLVAIRAHSAEDTVRREHETLVSEWMQAGFRLHKLVAAIRGSQLLISFSLVALLVIFHLGRASSVGTVLLLVYWALNLPALGQEVAVLWSRYPWHRNVALRLLEPLGAPDDETESVEATPSSPTGAPPASGVALSFNEVSVAVGGNPLLAGVTLDILAGEHVAVIGPSGAGKSTLVGLLLGWYRASTGELRADGERLEGAKLDQLRAQTAWADPSVRLWNRSLIDNLNYGGQVDGFGTAIDLALLKEVLESLPDGMQTPLGEGGALVSGGEGQRVRLARGAMRPGARLVVLDEPFRGLDRIDRNLLLERSRRLWSRATMFFITHDVRQTLTFDRVVVVESGRVVELGRPEDLARQPSSIYRRMLREEAEAREALWSQATWKRFWLENGRLQEMPGEGAG